MIEKAIAIEQLQFHWRGSDELSLHIPEFSLAAGQKVLLAGPSGCGKSTLLSLIGGVLHPHRGRIQILGQDLTNLSDSQRDRFRGDHIGFVFQLFNSIPLLQRTPNGRC